MGFISIGLGVVGFLLVMIAMAWGRLGWQGALSALGLLVSCFLAGISFLTAHWVLRYLRRITSVVEGGKWLWP